MRVLRWLAFLCIAAIALFLAFITVTNQPNQDLTSSQSALISAALSDNAANDANAENVNQQMVVNGWVAKDLLVINARQNVNLIELQSRTNALLQGMVLLMALLVVGVASLGVAVNNGKRRQRHEAQPPVAARPGESLAPQPPAPPPASA